VSKKEVPGEAGAGSEARVDSADETASEPAARQRDSGALAGLSVLVTGATSGIGRAIALATARAGADVALTYRSSEAGAREVARCIQEVGRRAFVFGLDLEDESSIARLGPAAQRALGRIDAWINNAGADILTGRATQLSDVEKLDLLLRVDLRGTVLASWQAVELMRAQPEGGVIINMSWDHVITGMPGRNPEMFSAVKGGVMSFSKSLARSVAPEVRVNILAPGWIETAFGAGLDERHRRQVAESTPLKRWGTPEDVASAAVYLASRDAAFLTGHTINVNGGVVM
jgi:3-oxoacyl-[acyl-carrier protein] reductase